MKKIFVFLLLFAVSFTVFSQPVTTTAPMFKSDYLKKSKSQKTAAWVLLSGGTVLTVTGLVISSNSAINELASAFSSGRNDKAFVTGEVLTITGCLSMLGSIPLFISSAKNKRRAMATTAFFKMETAPLIQYTTIALQSYPAFSIKINL
ncbi:MAG: hypothetical protein ACHQEB_02380 [Chitinophagales bacterium]